MHMEKQHPAVPGLSEACKNVLDSVEQQIHHLMHLDSPAFVAYDWELIVSPMQEAIEYLKEGATAAADFLIHEFHQRLVGDEKGLFFECDDQPKNSTTSAPLTDVDPTDTLQLLSTVGKECPKTFAKQTTLSKLVDWVDLQATVYQCAMSGALPRNTSKDRQHIWSKPISSSNETEHNGSHGSLYEHDTENNEQSSLSASLSFVCSSEHRLDYLNAMVPGTKKMLQQNQCKAIAGRKPFSMASSTLELTIKRYRQSYIKSGKLVLGTAPGQPCRSSFEDQCIIHLH